MKIKWEFPYTSSFSSLQEPRKMLFAGCAILMAFILILAFILWNGIEPLVYRILALCAFGMFVSGLRIERGEK